MYLGTLSSEKRCLSGPAVFLGPASAGVDSSVIRIHMETCSLREQYLGGWSVHFQTQAC